MEIPLGPDNFIMPKEYDGRQPTSFPDCRAGDAPDGGGGGGAAGAGPQSTTAAEAAGAGGGQAAGRGRRSDGNRHDRERGVFTVTVPADFKGDVVWTLRYAGQTWSVPGRAKSIAYQLSWPMAMGSTPPFLRFAAGRPGRPRPMGIQAASARSQGWNAARLDGLAHRRRRARKGTDQGQAGSRSRDERDLVQALAVPWRAHRLRAAQAGIRRS